MTDSMTARGGQAGPAGGVPLVRLTQPTGAYLEDGRAQSRPIWVNPRLVALVYGAGPTGGGVTVIQLGPDAAAVTVTEPVDDVVAALQAATLPSSATKARPNAVRLGPEAVIGILRLAEQMSDTTAAETVRRGLLALEVVVGLAGDEDLVVRNRTTGTCERVRFAWMDQARPGDHR